MPCQGVLAQVTPRQPHHDGRLPRRAANVAGPQLAGQPPLDLLTAIDQRDHARLWKPPADPVDQFGQFRATLGSSRPVPTCCPARRQGAARRQPGGGFRPAATAARPKPDAARRPTGRSVHKRSAPDVSYSKCQEPKNQSAWVVWRDRRSERCLPARSPERPGRGNRVILGSAAAVGKARGTSAFGPPAG